MKSSFKNKYRQMQKMGREEMLSKVTANMDIIKRRFFQSQLENTERDIKGRRYTLDDKVLALTLMKQCGSGYKALRNIFNLPSKKTLMRLLNRIPIKAGMCEGIFNIINSECKTLKDNRDKCCLLIFHEMYLKPGFSWNYSTSSIDGFEDFGYKRTQRIADHAQVYMLTGLKKSWKQPILFNFVSGASKQEDIINTLKTIIAECGEAINIVGLICDQDYRDEFIEILDHKIVPLYDPPHLLKGIRNNFMKYNVRFEMDNIKYVAKWEHIVTAYKMDCSMGDLRIMPKITDRHVQPNHLNKMKVSVCTQIMSHSVATAINLMAFSGTEIQSPEGRLKLEKEAIGTAKFLEFFNKLFDSVNGNNKTSNPIHPLKGPLTESSSHFKFWSNAIKILNSMEFIKTDGSTFRPPSLNNFIKTINHFKFLYNILKTNGFSYLMTRKCNQDPLENFFGNIRQRGIRYNNPTVAAFIPFFKSLLVKGFTSQHSVGANCEKDDSEIFVTLKKFIAQGLSEETDDEQQELVDQEQIRIKVPNLFPMLSLVEQHALKYVAGYIIKKCNASLKKCQCSKIILEKSEEAADLSDQFVKLKQFKNCKLKYISNFFFYEMVKALHIIKYALNNFTNHSAIFKHIYRILYEKIDFTQCPHNDVLKKVIFTNFIRTVGHHFIKSCNRLLRGSDRRPLSQHAPSIFKNCREKYLKSIKK